MSVAFWLRLWDVANASQGLLGLFSIKPTRHQAGPEIGRRTRKSSNCHREVSLCAICKRLTPGPAHHPENLHLGSGHLPFEGRLDNTIASPKVVS